MHVTSRSLALEFATLFVLIPCGLAAWTWEVPGGAPVILTLVLFGAYVAGVLHRDPAFSWREEARASAPRREWLRVLVGALVGALALTAFAQWRAPRPFDLPLERPGLWAAVLLLYPVLSVVPQEVIYRTFLVHRYGTLFGRATPAVSAVAFGLAHLLFWNWIAVLFTLIGGGLFAWTYQRTGSLRLVVVEHALLGQAVFTVGLGRYFYGGTLDAVQAMSS
ncbi:MAG: CPBP family intramembrane glutamic endopeptidase [Planctomycetota bacterium]